MKFNFLVDENLEHYAYYFADMGQITAKAGRLLTAEDVKNQDILLVRSVTKVNEALLQQSQVQFVGSATIGTDHLDINYLQQQAIDWSNATGCNAQAVAEYVISALFHIVPQQFQEPNHFCLGIIGLGNVGTRLAKLAQRLGWQVKAYDPFVQSEQVKMVSWQEILQCDAISIHTPLTKTGDYPTYHLINQLAFAQMNPQAILINSARGEVIAEQDLIADMRHTGRAVVLDVFEFEPQVSQELLELLTLATPHIAGYSLEGKVRGTDMLYQRICQKFALPVQKNMQDLLPKEVQLFTDGKKLAEQLQQYLPKIYDITQDDKNLRNICKNGVVQQKDFDDLRKNYALRREWSAFGDNN